MRGPPSEKVNKSWHVEFAWRLDGFLNASRNVLYVDLDKASIAQNTYLAGDIAPLRQPPLHCCTMTNTKTLSWVAGVLLIAVVILILLALVLNCSVTSPLTRWTCPCLQSRRSNRLKRSISPPSGFRHTGLRDLEKGDGSMVDVMQGPPPAAPRLLTEDMYAASSRFSWSDDGNDEEGGERKAKRASKGKRWTWTTVDAGLRAPPRAVSPKRKPVPVAVGHWETRAIAANIMR